MPFQIEVTATSNNERLLTFSGTIDEKPPEELPLPEPGAVLNFDFEQVRAINSVGIRLMMEWMSKLENEKIFFHRVPKVLVDQINMVANFIPRRTKVASFFVPYYSEATGEEKNLLFTEGVNYRFGSSDRGIVRWPEVHDSEGTKMEIDVAERRYFQFMKDHI